MKHAALLAMCVLAACSREPLPLRVCADPNNLPYSNRAEQGFENKLASVIAKDLGRPLVYVWHAQRRGNVRETLNAGRCDLIPGMIATSEMVATTTPYYRSSYIIVSRKRDALNITGFDDPALRRLRLGVELVGDDGANTPPAHALARRHIIDNVRGFMVQGDYGKALPRDAALEALAADEIDVAFVWGPVAGAYAKRHPETVHLTPLATPFDGPQLPMAFDISVATRKDDMAFLKAIDTILRKRSDTITELLDRYGVPRTD